MRTPLTFPVKKPRGFPFVAGRGTARLTLYRVEKKNYVEFRFMRIKEDGKTKDHYFPNYDKARNWGNLMLFKLSRNEGNEIILKGVAKATYCRAVELARATGEALDTIVARSVEADKIIEGCNVTLIEMARDYVRRHPAKMPDVVVSTLVDEFVKSKQTAKRSNVYVESLRHRLKRFKE